VFCQSSARLRIMLYVYEKGPQALVCAGACSFSLRQHTKLLSGKEKWRDANYKPPRHVRRL
jgi:hypothetical protein